MKRSWEQRNSLFPQLARLYLAARAQLLVQPPKERRANGFNGNIQEAPWPFGSVIEGLSSEA